jgi:hypothetical protein
MIRPFAQIVLLGAVIVCVLDTALSAISLQAQVSYASFAPISVLIVGIFGFATARRCGIFLSPLCGAILGFFDRVVNFMEYWTR